LGINKTLTYSVKHWHQWEAAILRSLSPGINVFDNKLFVLLPFNNRNNA